MIFFFACVFKFNLLTQSFALISSKLCVLFCVCRNEQENIKLPLKLLKFVC